jgi:TolB protein
LRKAKFAGGDLKKENTMMKYFILAACSLVFLCTACEENRIEPTLYGFVRGTVVDDATGAPLVGSTVNSTPVSQVVNTDTNGNFLLENVEEGTVVVRVENIGFVSTTKSISVLENDTAVLSIRLRMSTSANVLPIAGQNLKPANLATDLHPDTVLLKWRRATDGNTNDILRYTILLTEPGKLADTVARAIADTCFSLKNLSYQTNYVWQVLVQDTSGTLIPGPISQFSTRAFPNNPILFARQLNGNYHIWSAADDGTRQVQLTNFSGNQWRPRRNPQRTRIAFLSDQGIQTNLYVMNNDGSDVRQVTFSPVNALNDLELDFTWSPDGSKLLFMSGNKLYTVLTDGSGLTLFATAQAGFTYTEVDWSGSTGHVLARLTGVNHYESQFIRYSNVGFQLAIELTDQPGAEGGPALSILGDKYLYTRDTSGLETPDGRQLDAHIFIRNKGGAVETDASMQKPAGTNDLDPRYTANGGAIIFVNTDNTGTGVKNIYTVNLLGLQRKLLIMNGEMPDWE